MNLQFALLVPTANDAKLVVALVPAMFPILPPASWADVSGLPSGTVMAGYVTTDDGASFVAPPVKTPATRVPSFVPGPISN